MYDIAGACCAAEAADDSNPKAAYCLFDHSKLFPLSKLPAIVKRLSKPVMKLNIDTRPYDSRPLQLNICDKVSLKWPNIRVFIVHFSLALRTNKKANPKF